ncbi:hypothetical protein AGLY_003111, partial [Aphis glycines]
MYKSITLSLTGNEIILSSHYFPSLNVYDDSEIALLCLQTFNSFPNINSSNNKFEIQVIDDNDNGENICFITLKTGCYEIKDINLKSYNEENDTNLTFDTSVDPNDFRSYIKCNGKIMFKMINGIAPLLGFEKRSYEPKYAIRRSEKAVNLNKSNQIKNFGETLTVVLHFTDLTNILNINPASHITKVLISDATKVQLSNNGFSYLFEKIRLQINGIEVDSTRVLGIISSLKGYLSGTPDNYNCYENAGLIFINKTNPTNFNVSSRLELILTRSHSDLNVLNVKNSESANSGKVNLNKIVWKVPYIIVDDEERSFETFEYPELGTTKKVVWNLKTASKLEKPRFIIIGLQKGRKNLIEKDCSVFYHCNLTNVKVFLNSIAYPYDNLNLDFSKNNFTLLYNMYTSFQESYHEKNIRNPILSRSTFLSNAPIINDSATASSVDVQLEIEASKSLT